MTVRQMLSVRAVVVIMGLAIAASRLIFGQSAAPLQFEAASVKVVNLATHPTFGNTGGPGTSDPSRIHLCCVGMYSLVMRAFDVEIDQIAGPAWIMDNMGPNLYQVDATMPVGTTREQFKLMVQNLLVERFHLEVHREARNFPGYELVVDKDGPKLKESAAAPNSAVADMPDSPKRRTDGSVILPPGPQILTSLGRGMVRVQAQQKSIGDLVKGLGRLIAQSLGEDPGDFSSRKARVIDKTGLSSNYDFTLEFACESCLYTGASIATTNGAPGALPGSGDGAVTGLPNIFVALEKQLGLRLVKTKDIPLDVIVVDRVDKVPIGDH